MGAHPSDEKLDKVRRASVLILHATTAGEANVKQHRQSSTAVFLLQTAQTSFFFAMWHKH